MLANNPAIFDACIEFLGEIGIPVQFTSFAGRMFFTGLIN